MTNEEMNTALYKKMYAEQETYRKWLLGQPPGEILKHAYEYTMRENVLLCLEYNDLPDAQAGALLKSSSPRGEVFSELKQHETGHTDIILDSIACRADTIIRAKIAQRHTLLATPVYRSPVKPVLEIAKKKKTRKEAR